MADLSTPEGKLVERLRERYTRDQVPPCPVCGAVLTIQSAGGGHATIYGCDKHRPFSMDHYERSRWTQYRPGDPDVLELIERASAAERERDELKAELERLREALTYAAMGLGRIHDSLLSNGPKQASGEMTAHFLQHARAALRTPEESL